MKSILFVLVVLAGVFSLETAWAQKSSLAARVASGNTVPCADKERGKWCDARNNPLPPQQPQQQHQAGALPPPPQVANTQCGNFSGNARAICEGVGGALPAVGGIFSD